MSVIYDDLFRYEGRRKFSVLLRYFFFTPSFRYIVLFRKTQLASNPVSRIFWKVLMRQCMLRTGIQIPEQTKIDKGLRIVHFGHIVIHPLAVIGKNFNIYHGVTIGQADGKRAGVPTIGDNVCIQTNAVLAGGIHIGNDVLIAPNAFVNFDVPAGCTVIGNPGKIIEREKSSASYIAFSV